MDRLDSTPLLTDDDESLLFFASWDIKESTNSALLIEEALIKTDLIIFPAIHQDFQDLLGGE